MTKKPTSKTSKAAPKKRGRLSPFDDVENGDGLTVKQRRFVEEYCTDYNATQAAIRAGYSENTAAIIGWENLRKPNISEAIKKRLSDLAMSAEEITRRLAQWGRGTVEPFVHATEWGIDIDLASEQAARNIHLVRKIKTTVTTRSKDGEVTKESRTEIELHDAKDAVIQLAKIQGLFIEKEETDRPKYDGRRFVE